MTHKISNLKEIVEKYNNFFFDLDGVIWCGPEKIKGGVEALQFLRDRKCNIYFITNSSIRNRPMLKQRFTDFGFEANLEEIFPSDYITSLYLTTNYPSIKKVIVVGADSLFEEIQKTGVHTIHMDNIPFDIGETIPSIIAKLDIEVQAVILGFDFHLNYQKICLISFYVQKGAKLIATNPDKYTMIGGFKVPGNGSIVSAIETASQIRAEISGKPNPFIIQLLIAQNKLDRSQCLMIGDNLQTDIAFGNKAGIDTLCVLTGVSTEQSVLQSDSATYYTDYL